MGIFDRFRTAAPSSTNSDKSGTSAQKATRLIDAPRFARNFEDALRGMWQRYQSQQEKHAYRRLLAF